MGNSYDFRREGGNTKSAGYRARPRSITGTGESSPPWGAGLGVGETLLPD
ncbi:MAG: hypothetical protein KA314_02310 [Chloroflexi bacterium]|nr:hypothetical protein [Chloroflexota bacterium]MBP8054642.1 hypothetical protein [Chloroflexota bacterium]